ncbi:MAG: hypothetical protein HY869_21220 [Chloroflexi bacterium]|nr:hypothetical protein [Chloroflexota bacterium]
MTRLIVGSAHRVIPSRQLSGYLYVVDLESRAVIQKTEGIDPPFRDFDSNPRGGMRGMRGIAAREGEIALSNYSGVFCFDRHWNLTRTFSHPVCASIHEVLFDGDGVMVASTGTDFFLRFDAQGGLTSAWFVHDDRVIARQAGIRKSPMTGRDMLSSGIDFRDRRKPLSQEYDKTHLNSIDRCPNGDVLISLGQVVDAQFSTLTRLKAYLITLGVWEWLLKINRGIRGLLRLKKRKLSELVVQASRSRSAILRLSPDGKVRLVLLLENISNPSHSVRALADGSAIYLDTTNGSVIHFDAETGALLSTTEVTDQFLRGAVRLPDGRFALGAGNEVLIFDLALRQVVDRIRFSNNPLESVHGLNLLPPDFDLPPDSLQAKFGRVVDFDGHHILWDRSANANPDPHP